MKAQEIEEENIKWTSHLFVERPLISALLVLFIAGILIVVRVVFESWFYSILALFFFLISLGRYFFPTTYELNAREVKIRFLLTNQRRKWSEFQTFYKSARGIVLSPYERPRALDSYRGVHLLCEKKRDEVIEFVAKKLKRV